MESLLGKGVYSLPEAARLAKIDIHNARRWFFGRSDQPNKPPVLHHDIPSVQGKHAFSFLDLIDLLVVGRFREKGVSLQTVRKVYSRLTTRFEVPHPFGHVKLKTDGRTVFLELVDEVGDEHLEEVLSGQGAMPRILERYLRDIDYNAMTNVAERWNIAPGVVIDPARNFGKPMTADSGTSTYILASTFEANSQNTDLVADLFCTTSRAVMQAVQFENSLHTTKAA